MKNLRALRQSHGMSQQKLADAIGVAQSQIHAYETGKYEPDSEKLAEIANLFETSVDYVLGNTSIVRKFEAVEAYELNSDESKLVDSYRQLSPGARTSVQVMISALLNEKDNL